MWITSKTEDVDLLLLNEIEADNTETETVNDGACT